MSAEIRNQNFISHCFSFALFFNYFLLQLFLLYGAKQFCVKCTFILCWQHVTIVMQVLVEKISCSVWNTVNLNQIYSIVDAVVGILWHLPAQCSVIFTHFVLTAIGISLCPLFIVYLFVSKSTIVFSEPTVLLSLTTAHGKATSKKQTTLFHRELFSIIFW